MAKYLMVYKSASVFDITKLPKEQVTQMMQAWGEWVGSVGPAVLDEGNAFNACGKRVQTDMVSAADDHAAGYSIVEASNFDEALQLARTCPVVQRGGSVEVYEAFGV